MTDPARSTPPEEAPMALAAQSSITRRSWAPLWFAGTACLAAVCVLPFWEASLGSRLVGPALFLSWGGVWSSFSRGRSGRTRALGALALCTAAALAFFGAEAAWQGWLGAPRAEHERAFSETARRAVWAGGCCALWLAAATTPPRIAWLFAVGALGCLGALAGGAAIPSLLL